MNNSLIINNNKTINKGGKNNSLNVIIETTGEMQKLLLTHPEYLEFYKDLNNKVSSDIKEKQKREKEENLNNFILGALTLKKPTENIINRYGIKNLNEEILTVITNELKQILKDKDYNNLNALTCKLFYLSKINENVSTILNKEYENKNLIVYAEKISYKGKLNKYYISLLEQLFPRAEGRKEIINEYMKSDFTLPQDFKSVNDIVEKGFGDKFTNYVYWSLTKEKINKIENLNA